MVGEVGASRWCVRWFGTGPLSLPSMLQMLGMVVGMGAFPRALWLAWGWPMPVLWFTSPHTSRLVGLDTEVPRSSQLTGAWLTAQTPESHPPSLNGESKAWSFWGWCEGQYLPQYLSYAYPTLTRYIFAKI